MAWPSSGAGSMSSAARSKENRSMSTFTDIASARRAATEHGKASRSVAQFEVRLTRYLDQDGNPVAELPAVRARRGCARADVPAAWCSRACSTRRRSRCSARDNSARIRRAWARRPPRSASARPMARDDVLLASYRETGTMLVRGVRMSDILLYWGGDERGMAYTASRRAASGLSDLRADRVTGAAGGRRSVCAQAPTRTARRGLCARRRRDRRKATSTKR